MKKIYSKTLRRRQETLIKNISRHYLLYLMVLPGLIFLILVRVVPLAGSVIAWQEYSIFKTIFTSPWVGWKNFQEMFQYYDFLRIFRNTLLIGLYRIVFGFPIPIIIALLLNEVSNQKFKRFAQTSLYLPYFLSWVIVSQLFMNILHPDSGIVNIFLRDVLGLNSIFFFSKEELFQPIVTISYIWKTAGYQSIIYLAALTVIDPNLYEAASIDGASRWQQVWTITLPSLMPTVIVLLLLQIGRFLEIGFDQIYTLINPLVQSTGDIFDTYVYRVGLIEGRYSFTTAIGLFKSIIGLILILGANYLAKKATGEGLFK